MTTLTKPIKREIKVPRIPKPVIVTIDPETYSLGFREKGCRAVYWLPIATAFQLAVESERKASK